MQRKLAVLNLTAGAELAPDDVMLHYLVGACDPHEIVARRAEELLRKRCAVDAAKPVVNLEEPGLVRSCSIRTLW